MGIIKVDHTKFLAEIHALIDNIDDKVKPSTWRPDFVQQVDALIDEHRISLSKSSSTVGENTYGHQLAKLIMCGSRVRAHKLADAIGTSGYTWTGAVAAACLSWLLRKSIFIGVVVVIVLVVLHFLR